jgi:PIN domain nuclease of toxin-antitoxin system
MHHQDPFDRMLVAHAQRIGATVVSRDRQLAAYDIHVLPA